MTKQIFGSGSQQYTGYLKRLIKDLIARLKATENPEEYKVLISSQKRVEVWVEVLVAYNTFGAHSGQFQSTWDEQHHFADLDLVVKWDFPSWWCVARLESKVLNTTSGVAFWKEISSESLSAGAVPNILEAQARLLPMKVALIASTESTLAKELQVVFESSEKGKYSVEAGVQAHCASVHYTSYR